MKIKSIYIQNYKVLNDFKIDFCNNSVINPITVICGINGSGKTTLLEFINEVFKKRNITVANQKSKIEIEQKGLFPSKPLTGKYEYTLTSNFLKSEKKNFLINISDKLIYYKAGEENLSASKLITEYIDELIYEKDVKSSLAYEELRSYLNKTLKRLNLEVEFGSLDKNKEIYFKNAQSDKIKLKDLSGGEKEIITKIFPLYISNIKDSVIIIDEPESSLHPNWQNEIMSLYQKIAEQNNNQIIITTHSPHIVSAIHHKYLKILKKEDGVVKVIDSSTKTYGKKIDEILLEIFRVNGLRTPAVELKIGKLKDFLKNNKYKTNEFENLLNELETNIGKFDSDLAFIRMEMKRKEVRSEKDK